ncbi:CpsD/CapB family tyrosine-protein kinase [Propionivibrio sp.]|uniref:CpsD/CapB family tyrosine-protein kinase n=1 Tax=Propionivibrio sp. TaxID=2212460 RepID=UPI003BF03B1A
MERIKQALDKIRQFEKGSVPVALERMPESLPLQVSALENINYTHSRVVELDPAHLEKHRVVMAYNKGDPVASSFDLLRTQVLRRMKENKWRTLAITSPTPGAGKTVVAINLAISIAQHTETSALLVDFDLRRPKVGTYLGITSGKSLNELLTNEASLPEVLVNPGIPRLLVLPTHRPVLKSSEQLTSRRVIELVAELRSRYDSRVVIFDLPPILSADDAIAILPQIDCYLLVVADGWDNKLDIEESMNLMQRANLLGTVLNKADVPINPYGYPYY